MVISLRRNVLSDSTAFTTIIHNARTYKTRLKQVFLNEQTQKKREVNKGYSDRFSIQFRVQLSPSRLEVIKCLKVLS